LRRNQQSANRPAPLVVTLVGPVPCWGVEQIRRYVTAKCSFRLFPKFQEDKNLWKHLVGADAVVAQYFTERMASAANRLRLLHAVGAGVDTFCMDALAKSTTVSNVYFHGPAIAEYVMMVALALNRNLLEMDSQFRRGVWCGSWIRGDHPPAEISGKTLGLIGFGHIGREIAYRAKAFGMKVRALSVHPRDRKPRILEAWYGPDRLRELLRESDFLVLACPLTDQTRGLIGAREFGWMKRSACLINIGRAPIVDESALYQALHRQLIRTAAIDVWYRYPVGKQRLTPSRYPFHKLANIVMTPHIAGWTSETFEERFRTIAANFDRLAAGRRLLNVVRGPSRHGPLPAHSKLNLSCDYD
jgi:phosphoglycerate dehydrogenase-like enzyme